MLKNQLTDVYANSDDDNYEIPAVGSLVWFIWSVMTVVGVVVLTVSVMSLVFFSVKLDDTFNTFQQSTIMLAPDVFNLACTKLPPPLDFQGIEWGVNEVIQTGSMSDDGYYDVIDSEVTHEIYNNNTYPSPLQATKDYTVSFKTETGNTNVNYQLFSNPTFSINGLKDMIMKANGYPDKMNQQSPKPIILTHAKFMNIKTVGGVKETFSICHGQNCELDDQYEVRGFEMFSIVGWNDKLRSIGQIKDIVEGTTQFFQGGFIARLPKKEIGHTLGYFTANFSDTMENKICPNAVLRKNWIPVVVNYEANESYDTDWENCTTSAELNNGEMCCYIRLDDDIVTSYKEEPTPLHVRDGICDDSNNYCKKFGLNEESTYYVIATDGSYPNVIKTYLSDTFDIALLECDSDPFTDGSSCQYLIIHQVCDQLLTKIFIPSNEYMEKHANGEECNYTLLPYDTLLKMNYLLLPTAIPHWQNSIFSYDFSNYNYKIADGSSKHNVLRNKFIDRVETSDILFFTT
ncbi:Uncharacterized protein QTN25_005716 [Entamoeba marina]